FSSQSAVVANSCGERGKSVFSRRGPRSRRHSDWPACDKRQAAMAPPKPEPTTTASYDGFIANPDVLGTGRSGRRLRHSFGKPAARGREIEDLSPNLGESFTGELRRRFQCVITPIPASSLVLVVVGGILRGNELVVPDNIEMVAHGQHDLALGPEHGGGIHNAVVIPKLKRIRRSGSQHAGNPAGMPGPIKWTSRAGAITNAVGEVGSGTEFRIFGQLRVSPGSGKFPNRSTGTGREAERAACHGRERQGPDRWVIPTRGTAP